MELEFTQDDSTIIIYRQSNVIIYYRYEDDRSWIIVGRCHENGDCGADGKIRELDCPVTPKTSCITNKLCGLLGEWI